MTAIADTIELLNVSAPAVTHDDLVRTTQSDDWRATIQIRSEPCRGLAEHVRRELQSHLSVSRVLLRVDVSAVEHVDEEVTQILVEADVQTRLSRGTFVIVGASRRAIESICTTHGGERLLIQARA